MAIKYLLCARHWTETLTCLSFHITVTSSTDPYCTVRKMRPERWRNSCRVTQLETEWGRPQVYSEPTAPYSLVGSFSIFSSQGRSSSVVFIQKRSPILVTSSCFLPQLPWLIVSQGSTTSQIFLKVIFAIIPGLSLSKSGPSHRRETPLECATSSYFSFYGALALEP